MRLSQLSLSRTFVVLGGSIIIFVLLSFSGALNPIKSFTQGFLSPVSERVYAFGLSIQALIQTPGDIESLQLENERLRDENTQLLQDLSELQQAKTENETLRTLLDFFENDRTNLKSVVSRIVGKDPENPSILYLNSGARDGVEIGNAVIVEDGILIAKIVEVFAQSSKAIILTASESQVAVSISGGAPASKIARGERGLSIILDQIPQQEVIQQGELVITSGLESNIPNGLLVGQIEEIISEKNDLFQKAILRPLADADSAQIVSIVLSPFEG